MRDVRSGLVFAAIAAVLLAGCGDAAIAPSDDARSSPALPAGWRWESYRGVEVGVPGDWGYARSSTGQITTQWCTDLYHPVEHVVARPGLSTAAGCFTVDPIEPSRGPDPGTLIATTGIFVAFDGITATANDGPRREGDRATVTVNGVTVAVQAPARLREQIVATIHPTTADSNGCPTSHQISNAPDMRPDPAVDVGSLAGVTAVTACKYAVHAGVNAGGHGPALLSSLRLTGEAAQAAISGIAEAPRGGGPDAPSTCAMDFSYGDDIIVLSITSGQTRNEIYLRYSGCDHNGFDDGIAVRSLTTKSVAPFIAGPNAVLAMSGPRAKVGILYPDQASDAQ
jgi:hypothetical protein